MKKTNYTGFHMPDTTEIKQELEIGKSEDYDLPEFTKEIPKSSKKSESDSTITIEYEWDQIFSPSIKVKEIEYRSGERLEGLYRINARDGADSISFTHNGTTYILRKTMKEIARAIYNAHGKIHGAIENVIGYLRSVAGMDYIISKIENESWVFDRRIARGPVIHVEVDDLDQKSRTKLIEMITEKISELHANNLIIGRFTLNNILLGKEDMKFTDLRRLRVSRKRSYVIDEFKSILQYLYAVGIASKEDIYVSVATYAAANEKSCNEWYEQKTGKAPEDQIDLVDRIEEDIYS
ncbi:hypothetical protein JXA56_03240 [Candidatus Micrarchaeota archaeon]|nr:hypothetical protein [Candidatus Micrarchaeota archaeon]